MSNTIISWTDFTFNPWMGCSKVSAGCKNCYAEKLVKNRMGIDAWGNAQRKITKTTWANLRKENDKMLAGESGVQGRGRPRLVFVGSLMDWAEDLPELLESRQRLWEAIRAYQGLHFQLLTKRAENIEKFLPSDWGDAGYPNVWLGVSVEDNQVSGRVAILSRIPAAVRFISYEPVLGPLSLNGSAKIDWVIAGGESGPNYRAMNLEWVRDMRNYCSQTRTAFFFKQSNGTRTEMGTTLDGETIKEFPTPRPSHCST